MNNMKFGTELNDCIRSFKLKYEKKLKGSDRKQALTNIIQK